MAVQHTAKLSGKLGNNFNLFEDIQCGAITNRNTVQVLLGLKKKTTENQTDRKSDVIALN